MIKRIAKLTKGGDVIGYDIYIFGIPIIINSYIIINDK